MQQDTYLHDKEQADLGLADELQAPQAKDGGRQDLVRAVEGGSYQDDWGLALLEGQRGRRFVGQLGRLLQGTRGREEGRGGLRTGRLGRVGWQRYWPEAMVTVAPTTWLGNSPSHIKHLVICLLCRELESVRASWSRCWNVFNR